MRIFHQWFGNLFGLMGVTSFEFLSLLSTVERPGQVRQCFLVAVSRYQEYIKIL